MLSVHGRVTIACCVQCAFETRFESGRGSPARRYLLLRRTHLRRVGSPLSSVDNHEWRPRCQAVSSQRTYAVDGKRMRRPRAGRPETWANKPIGSPDQLEGIPCSHSPPAAGENGGGQ